MNPESPVYIVSKGRWETRLTSNAFEKMQVPYYLVVEKQEYDKYADVIDPAGCAIKILILPERYKKDYNVVTKIDEDHSTGPGPARNFCWDHSIELGVEWHWVLDDNIFAFSRLNKNYHYRVTSGTIFKIAEDFTNRYENVAITGLNYDFFAIAKTKIPPFIFNTRIYSCLLIRNDIPYRWRGRYNEDTDLSLRVLKDGWCTIQFNAFVQEKATTQTMKGGNTQEFYDKEGTLKKSQILLDMHPDVSRVVWKFGRWHHHVNYKPFARNKPIKKKDLVIPKGVNNYGMKLVEVI